MEDRAALIDRYGELKRQIDEFKPTVEEAKKLEAEIASWYEDHPAEDAAIAEGAAYTVQVSPREFKREIYDKGKALHLVRKACGGITALLELLTLPLKVIDQYVPEQKQKLFLVKERTGPRTVKPVRKAA